MQPQQRLMVKMKWLDLRGSGISVLERLLLEEFLWRHNSFTNTNWMLVGHHEPAHHRYLKMSKQQRINNNYSNNNAAVLVLGIGGKPGQLLDLDRVREDRVLTLKRFSGGGTVVLDPDSIWTTVIASSPSTTGTTTDTSDGDDDEKKNSNIIPVERFPRPIMEWSMGIFGRMADQLGEIQQQNQSQQHQLHHHKSRSISKEFLPGSGRKLTMVLDSKSCGASENSGRLFTIPDKNSRPSTAATSRLTLRENDYVLGGGGDGEQQPPRKVAGNAQSIGKSGWLHHTCWLWDYQPENMQYLQLPNKRPEYRKDRSHDDFLTTLRSHFPLVQKSQFYACLKQVTEAQFDVETVTLPTVMDMVIRSQQHHDPHVDTNGGGGGTIGGAMQKLLETSRTKVLTDL